MISNYLENFIRDDDFFYVRARGEQQETVVDLP